MPFEHSFFSINLYDFISFGMGIFIFIFVLGKKSELSINNKKIKWELPIILLYISIIIYNYFCNDFVVSISFC